MPNATQSAPPRGSLMPTTGSSVTPTVTLDPELGLPELARLKLELMECMDVTGPVTLSAAAVKRIGTPALQVLASFAVDCKRRGRSVHWQDFSPEFSDAVRLLGLGSTLAIDQRN